MNSGSKPLAAFGPFEERMRQRGVYPLVIETFRRHYEQLCDADDCLIYDRDIEAADNLQLLADIDTTAEETGRASRRQVVVVKLNGGLGTGMGLAGPKSLIPVRGDYSFLEIIIRQSEQHDVPVLLMNSEATDQETRAALNTMQAQGRSVPQTFLQNMVPKVRQEDRAPVTWPADPKLEWCPPGHGDLYAALFCSGKLDELLSQDIRYAFVSNSDNLGATLDFALLGHFVKSGAPFMMEVARRQEMDAKGGHLARKGHRWILRESAQCPEADREKYQRIDLHQYFNTNNIWLDLQAVRDCMVAGKLNLPWICNSKTVDPTNSTSTPVYQLETAMGAAIEVFEDARAICVPRTRFAPVKTTNELLLVRSDAYELTDDGRLVCRQHATITLDSAFYRHMEDFEERFAAGPPSLRECDSLSIKGDFRFGADVVMKGDVELIRDDDHPVHIPGGAILSGRHVEGSAPL